MVMELILAKHNLESLALSTFDFIEFVNAWLNLLNIAVMLLLLFILICWD